MRFDNRYKINRKSKYYVQRSKNKKRKTVIDENDPEGSENDEDDEKFRVNDGNLRVDDKKLLC